MMYGATAGVQMWQNEIIQTNNLVENEKIQTKKWAIFAKIQTNNFFWVERVAPRTAERLGGQFYVGAVGLTNLSDSAWVTSLSGGDLTAFGYHRLLVNDCFAIGWRVATDSRRCVTADKF